MNMWELASSCYGDVSGDAKVFFKERFDINSLSPGFKKTMQSVVDRITETNAYIKTLHTCRKLRYSDGSNEIRQYSCLDELQFANSRMEPYLVALPEYRKPYNDNRAAGFEDSFSKYDKYRGNAYMNTDVNFREITSGLSNDYDEQYITTWDTDLDRKEVSNIDRIDVMITWGRALEMDWEDSDPFSQYGGCVE